MTFNIGINVVEVDGRAAPTIAAAPISVAGFLVRSQRGIPNVAIPLRGIADFFNNFGGYSTNRVGAHVVRGFFENGGAEAYAVRIVSNDASAASSDVADRNGSNTLQVMAGTRGQADPGQWGNALGVQFVDHPRGTATIPAQLIGTQAEPFALSDGAMLTVTATTTTGLNRDVIVTFNSADFSDITAATAAEVAAAINRQTTDLRVGTTFDQRLVLISDGSNTHVRLAVTDNPVSQAVGLGGADTDSGIAADVTTLALQSVGGFLPGSAVHLTTRAHLIAPNAIQAAFTAGSSINITANGNPPVTVTFNDADFNDGIGAVTPAEVVATINRQAIGFEAALTPTNNLILYTNSYGAASNISVSAGGTDATGDLGIDTISSPPVAGGEAYAAVAGVSEADRTITLAASLAVTIVTGVSRLRTVEFDVLVTRDGAVLEQHESLSMQPTLDYYAPTVINDPLSGSRFIVANDLDSGSGVGRNAPVLNQVALGATVTGSDGSLPTPANYIGDPAQRTGFYAFDTINIQLLACPEIQAESVMAAGLNYCEQRGDAMFVGTAPQGYDLEGVQTYASAFRARKVYGAMYAPWIQIINPQDTDGRNPRLWIPPDGHVLGCYARIGAVRGVAKAPAGDEARLRGALGVAFDMTDSDHTNLVKNGSVNGIRAIPGSGIIIDASRTLSTDTRWLYVNVRRLFNFVKSSLREGLRWVAQEPHSGELRRTVRYNVITPFLLGLWRQGAFGSGTPDQTFTVICDETNNSPAEVNLGNFRVDVYFYPVKPAETIIVVVGQQESGASAAEA